MMYYKVSYKHKMVETHTIETTNPVLVIQRTLSKDHDISREYNGWVAVSQGRNTPAKFHKGEKA